MVIPDTQNMYNKAENTIVFDLYEVGSLREGETSLLFVHGVELAGPKGEVVRFWSVSMMGHWSMQLMKSYT